MRILVTGGAGYIGSHAVAALLERGCEVVVLDDLSTGHAEAVDARATFVRGDVNDVETTTAALAGVDAVLHFAGLSQVAESVRRPAAYDRANRAGTIALLQAMDRAGVRRLVYSSTAAIYGVPTALPITEDSPARPINPYGVGKAAAERAIGEASSSSAILRYFNVAGSDGVRGEAHDPETHLIPLVLEVASGRRPFLDIHGTDHPTADGTCVRDYVHVCDLVDAHLRVLDALAPGVRRIYNIGVGRGHSVREVIAAAQRVTGRAIEVREAERRPGDPPVLYAATDRIASELGWRGQRDLDAILASHWAWLSRRGGTG